MSGNDPESRTLFSPTGRPAVEAREIERIVDGERVERLLVGEFLDAQHDVAEIPAERLRQAWRACRADGFDGGGAGCGAEGLTCAHGKAT